jgi:hypothetical protein
VHAMRKGFERVRGAPGERQTGDAPWSKQPGIAGKTGPCVSRMVRRSCVQAKSVRAFRFAFPLLAVDAPILVACSGCAIVVLSTGSIARARRALTPAVPVGFGAVRDPVLAAGGADALRHVPGVARGEKRRQAGAAAPGRSGSPGVSTAGMRFSAGGSRAFARPAASLRRTAGGRACMLSDTATRRPSAGARSRHCPGCFANGIRPLSSITRLPAGRGGFCVRPREIAGGGLRVVHALGSQREVVFS